MDELGTSMIIGWIGIIGTWPTMWFFPENEFKIWILLFWMTLVFIGFIGTITFYFKGECENG